MSFLERIPVGFRLAIVHAAWMFVLFVIIGFSLYKIVETDLYHSVDAALLSSAQTIKDAQINFAEESFSHDQMLEKILESPFHMPDPWSEEDNLFVNPFFQIINVSGKVFHKSDATFLTLPLTDFAIHRAEYGNHTYETFTFKNRASLRLITLPLSFHGAFRGDVVQVATSLRPTFDTLKSTALLLMFTLSFVLLVSIILGHVLTVQALKPVRLISQAASKLGTEDMSVRLPLSIANDELKELSQTFNAMLDRLEDAFKRLRRFTADVSHELRTPIAVIRGESELALRKERASEEYKRSLQTVSKEAHHMTSIVEDLLLLARADSQALPMQWTQIHAESFIQDLRDSLAHNFQLREISLKTLCQPELTAIVGSKGYLTLALKNILLNAAKHSPSPGEVIFSLFKDQDKIHFEISDQGEGIPEQDIPYIFDPFYRVDSVRNRSAGGVGIGLSLTLAMIKLHNGAISVSSKAGKGTTFTVKIPCRSPLELA